MKTNELTPAQEAMIEEGDFGFDATVADVAFELETRYNWKDGNRPFYSTINVPLRRARHLQHNARWMYAQVSGDGKAFLVLPNPQIVFPQSPQQYSKNKDDDGYPEAFYKIPRERFKWLFVDHTCQDEQDFIDILLQD